jgi:hypothetical protein
MHQFAIRCHPCSPVTSGEIDEWLRAEVERLREQTPHADAEVGWLIEFDASGDEAPLDDELAQILRDLRLLGLQPTLLQARAMVGSDVASNGFDR